MRVVNPDMELNVKQNIVSVTPGWINRHCVIFEGILDAPTLQMEYLSKRKEQIFVR
jgi:hypothetical protein